MKTDALIHDLLAHTAQITRRAKALSQLDEAALRWKPQPTVWNILECIEHLNRYGDFYLPEMERKIRHSRTTPQLEFRSGILGKYFVNSILPQLKTNKMKTAKDKNPLNETLDISVFSKFLSQQNQLHYLLELSQIVNLNRVKIRTSISPLIHLKLGDALQFYVYHILRHFQQIDCILEKSKMQRGR
ncbi:DinB family protein [Riemerella columbina]|uniref:DinB family protein n=1 Tax=Riemerella columbina TaxID=103810 RepID=UPI00266F6B04|nr:DinB family protein [Riemerella columbina]WKS95352.1 DinB family protein [Riemerella columbina]